VDLTAGFHIYAVHRGQNRVRFYFDNQLKKTVECAPNYRCCFILGLYQKCDWTLPFDESICVFIYANGGDSSRPVDISVNGSTVVSNLDFPGPSDWTYWTSASVTLNLNSGNNVIRFTGTGSEGGPYLDRMDITVNGTDTPVEFDTLTAVFEYNGTPVSASTYVKAVEFGKETLVGYYSDTGNPRLPVVHPTLLITYEHGD
jgi:hypothetical protein